MENEITLQQTDTPTPEPTPTATPYIAWPTPTLIIPNTPPFDLNVENYAPQFAQGVQYYVSLYQMGNQNHAFDLFIIAVELVMIVRAIVTVIKRISKALVK